MSKEIIDKENFYPELLNMMGRKLASQFIFIVSPAVLDFTLLDCPTLKKFFLP